MRAPMNYFDAAIYGAGAILIITGFSAGLLRGLVTIAGYIAAMPIAIWLTAVITPELSGKMSSPWNQNSQIFFVIFLTSGIVIGFGLRAAVNEMIGHDINIFDRLAGSFFGVARVLLIALTMVMVFDRLIPIDRQPGFLAGSKLKPILSSVGQKVLKTLPPDMVAYVDQLKREKGL
jgi:membrane protein required for colicin V production